MRVTLVLVLRGQTAGWLITVAGNVWVTDTAPVVDASTHHNNCIIILFTYSYDDVIWLTKKIPLLWYCTVSSLMFITKILQPQAYNHSLYLHSLYWSMTPGEGTKHESHIYYQSDTLSQDAVMIGTMILQCNLILFINWASLYRNNSGNRIQHYTSNIYSPSIKAEWELIL